MLQTQGLLQFLQLQIYGGPSILGIYWVLGIFNCVIPCFLIPFAGCRLSVSSLCLLVPTLRLMCAFAWQVVQCCNVLHYGKVEELVRLVSELAPELLTPRENVQLMLRLRARVRHQAFIYLYTVKVVFLSVSGVEWTSLFHLHSKLNKRFIVVVRQTLLFRTLHTYY